MRTSSSAADPFQHSKTANWVAQLKSLAGIHPLPGKTDFINPVGRTWTFISSSSPPPALACVLTLWSPRPPVSNKNLAIAVPGSLAPRLLMCLLPWSLNVILMLRFQAHNFSLLYQQIIPEFICQHFQIGCYSEHQKIVAVLFQVQFVAKPFVNARIDVILLEKHIRHERVA